LPAPGCVSVAAIPGQVFYAGSGGVSGGGAVIKPIQ